MTSQPAEYRVLGMGKVLGIITAGGLFFYLHTNGWVALAAGVGIWFYMSQGAGPNKLIQVINLDTGEIKTQPMDKAGEKYLSSRND